MKSNKQDLYINVSFSGAMLPYFPENVDNVTVQIGQSAELRCKVENLNNYKVRKRNLRGARSHNLSEINSELSRSLGFEWTLKRF